MNLKIKHESCPKCPKVGWCFLTLNIIHINCYINHKMCLNINSKNKTVITKHTRSQNINSLIFLIAHFNSGFYHIITLLRCNQDIYGHKSVRGPAHVRFDRGERPFW